MTFSIKTHIKITLRITIPLKMTFSIKAPRIRALSIISFI
jgi:hypothetical protein